jgi:hypothetical protein
MKNFSHRHKLQLSLAGSVYALALLRILHVIQCFMLFSFTELRNVFAELRVRLLVFERRLVVCISSLECVDGQAYVGLLRLPAAAPRGETFMAI